MSSRAKSGGKQSTIDSLFTPKPTMDKENDSVAAPNKQNKRTIDLVKDARTPSFLDKSPPKTSTLRKLYTKPDTFSNMPVPSVAVKTPLSNITSSSSISKNNHSVNLSKQSSSTTASNKRLPLYDSDYDHFQEVAPLKISKKKSTFTKTNERNSNVVGVIPELIESDSDSDDIFEKKGRKPISSRKVKSKSEVIFIDDEDVTIEEYSTTKTEISKKRALPSFEGPVNKFVPSKKMKNTSGGLKPGSFGTDKQNALSEEPVRLKGKSLTKDIKVNLSRDGVLTFDGIQQWTIDAETLNVMSELNIDISKNRLFLDAGGYILVGGLKEQYIHIALGRSKIQSCFEYWIGQGWTGTMDDLLNGHVAHLNDLRNDFRISNLFYVPQEVNFWSCKSIKGATKVGNNYRSSFWFNNANIFTKTVDTPAGALHHRDIIKIENISPYARDFIFKYGLDKPEQYAHTYTNIESLLACSPWYEKRASAPRALTKKSLPIEIIPFANADEIVKTSITMSGIRFDPLRDCVIKYSGPSSDPFQFVVEITCYNKHLKDAKGNLQLDETGYVNLNKRPLHLVVYEREVGKYKTDGKQIMHGLGLQRDNRRRILSEGYPSTNFSQINRKKENSSSKFHGVWKRPNGNPVVSMVFSGTRVERSYKTEELAAAARKILELKRDEILDKLVNVKDRKARVDIISTSFPMKGRTRK